MSLNNYLCCLTFGFYKYNFKSGIFHCGLQLRGLLVSGVRLIGLQLLLTIVIYNVCAELVLKCSFIINRFCEQKLKQRKNCFFHAILVLCTCVAQHILQTFGFLPVYCIVTFGSKVLSDSWIQCVLIYDQLYLCLFMFLYQNQNEDSPCSSCHWFRPALQYHIIDKKKVRDMFNFIIRLIALGLNSRSNVQKWSITQYSNSGINLFILNKLISKMKRRTSWNRF